MGNFLFITSTNLASNPRLLKELKLVLQIGHTATVVEFRVGNWSDGLTDSIKQDLQGVEFIELSAMSKPFVPWLMSSFLQKTCSLLPVSMMNYWMLSMSAGKRTLLLFQQLKKMYAKYDWVIAHNPAAFYPAYRYAKKKGAALGIDIEDYHPGETNDAKASKVMKLLMQYVLPPANYCSYASPLIAEEVQRDIPAMTNRQLVILNGFNGNEFPVPVQQVKNKLQLVWFSQNIDAGRGLEYIISVVNELSSVVEVHLIGNLKHDFAEQFLSNKTGIQVHAPMTQEALHIFLSHCDVGLATDLPVNRNREIALTNKILAYAQAGLYIVAFDTLAQRNFLSTYELAHKIMRTSKESVRETLLDLTKEPLSEIRKIQYNKSRSFDWNLISKKLQEAWQNKN